MAAVVAVQSGYAGFWQDDSTTVNCLIWTGKERKGKERKVETREK